MSSITAERVFRWPVSARVRIVGWMLLLVGSSLVVSIVGSAVIMSGQLDARVVAELRQEADEFRRFAVTARDPVTGRRYATGAGLIAAFLAAHLPSRTMTFFSIVDGRVDRRSLHAPSPRLDGDKEVVARFAAVRGTQLGWLDSPAGRVRYAVIPVQISGDPHDARLVLISFWNCRHAEVLQATQVLALTGFGALGVAGAISWTVAGQVLAPIRLVRRTAERIGESSDLTRRLKISGRDDVAALARTFNHMLGRLEQAFTVQRQFMNDAGHELRTPITVIRGHIELMGEDPHERAAVRELVLDELDRMGRIVGDLLMLAQAERPDFLTPDVVNLTDLTVEALAKAQALGPRKWRLASVAEGDIIADGQRLTQALMQLASNAVQHTREGDRVEIGSATRDGRVLLWVQDEGPGVEPADRERIFERFTQAGTRGGSSNHNGTGLGLAIVREIATAHAGTVRADAAEGGGALFVLDIPWVAPARKGEHRRARRRRRR